MASVLNNLDRESILMLYLAGELSADDQARVEKMLADDPAMRALHDELAGAQQSLEAHMSAADSQTALPAPVASSVRNVSVAMKQWHVNRLAAKPSTEVRSPRRMGWAYALGALAAVIVISVFVFYSHLDDNRPIAKDSTPDFPKVEDDNAPNATNDDNKIADANDQAKPSDTETDNESPEPNDTLAETTIGERESQLANAQSDLTTLSVLTESLRPDEGAVTP